MMTQRSVLALLVPLLFLAAGCIADTPTKGSTPMTQTQTTATQPLCVGRFLIDVPVSAEVRWTTTNTYEVGEIVSMPAHHAEFVRKIKAVEAQLRARTHYEEGQLFKEVVEPHPDAKVFVYRSDEFSTTGYELAGYVFNKAGGRYFLLKDGANNDRLARAKGRIAEGLMRLQPRDTWSIPTEPGFCFDNGFLPGKDTTFEATGVQLTFKGYPGLMIALETQTNDQGAFPGPDLITRTEEGQGIVEPHQRATMLRKNAKRSIGDRAGQEVMLKRQEEGALRLTAYLEVNAEPGRIDAPGIVFSLSLTPSDNMAERLPSEAEAEVTGLWDTIIQSLRLRPGAV
jgi:hypothetical protein